MDITHIQALLSIIFHTLDAYLVKMLGQLGVSCYLQVYLIIRCLVAVHILGYQVAIYLSNPAISELVIIVCQLIWTL